MPPTIFKKLSLAASVMATTVAFGQVKPPTLDPTFGMKERPAKAVVVVPQAEASWIWATETKDQQTVDFKQALIVKKLPKVAAIYVTADNYFRASINGHLIGQTKDIKGDDLVWSNVHRFDLLPFLKLGQNEILIEGTNAGGVAGILARIQFDGRPVLLTDKTWQFASLSKRDQWSPVAVIGPANAAPWGNSLKGWPVPLTTVPSYLHHLSIHPVGFAMITDGINGLKWKKATSSLHLSRPQGKTDGKPWRVLIDFGKELTGRIELRSRANATVKVGTGESIGEAVEKPWTTTAISLFGSPQFTRYTAFRYAAIEFPSTISKIDLTAFVDHLYYPVSYKGSFACSDPLLTKVWYTGAYTAHLCMQQDIWDAPKRDRLRWMGDLHVSGEVINDVFADRFLMEQTMRRLREDAQGGRPADQLPSQNVNGIPGYSCAWLAGMADYYRHVGDLKYLKSQQRAIITMLEYLRGELDADGVFANKHGQWPFVDWAPDFNGDTPSARAATHLFLVKAVTEAAFLLHELHDAKAPKYADWAKDLAKTARLHFADEKGTFGDRRQENSMAVYSGVATGEQRKAIYDAALRPASPAWKITVSPYYDNYVINALSQLGHTSEAMDFVRRFWGGMLAEGATSWWEGYDNTWPKKNFHANLQADNGTGYFVSLCHGWSAGPTSWLTDCVLGVKPTGAGFKTCTITPDLGDLEWVHGDVPTPHGNISVRVHAAGGKYRLSASIPAGIRSTITLADKTWQVSGPKSVTLCN